MPRRDKVAKRYADSNAGLRFGCGLSGRDVQKMLVMTDDTNAVRTDEPRFINDFVAVNLEKVWKHGARLRGKFFQCRGVDRQAR